MLSNKVSLKYLDSHQQCWNSHKMESKKTLIMVKDDDSEQKIGIGIKAEMRNITELSTKQQTVHCPCITTH